MIALLDMEKTGKGQVGSLHLNKKLIKKRNLIKRKYREQKKESIL
jgi:hypothetical protein